MRRSIGAGGSAARGLLLLLNCRMGMERVGALMDISQLLMQRGHEVTKQGSDRDILLPDCDDANVVCALKDILYFEMSKDSFRKTLRDMAFGNTELEGPSVDTVNGYLAICRSIGTRRGKRFQLTQGLYANTFEWYISQLFVREFAARASGFGIRLKDADPGDEFDCVALVDGGLVFVECKTGKGSLYPEVGKFMRRDKEVMAKYSFFLYDRDYTFNRGPEDLPDLEKASAVKLGIDGIARVEKNGVSFFEVTGPSNEHGESRFFLASSAFNGLRSRMRYMLRYTENLREFENLTDDFVHIPLDFA